MKRNALLLFASLFAIIFSCSSVEPELKILHQVTGPIETNCYLIYDNQTMEAALVDVGDAIDTLLQYIEENDLDVKYILCTHGHYDHVIGEPDILIEEGQELQLGNFTIKVIHSPGHSPGSVCYLVDGKLLSGDVLFYRTVGRTDVQNSSREDQIRSVQRLYEILPDSTLVYPGHMQFTDILSEKTLNSRIKADTVTW